LPATDSITVAPNGTIALEKARQLRPEVITLDVEMPDMNGLDVLEQLKKEGLMSDVVIVSSRARDGVEIAVRALALGAVDVVPKPEGGNQGQNIENMKQQFRPILAGIKIRRIVKSKKKSTVTSQIQHSKAPGDIAKRMRAVSSVPAPPKIVAIGASTGGPKALATVLSGLPADFKLPIVITLHMPSGFTNSMARILDAKSRIAVSEAVNGQIIESGKAYLAPGGKQMKVVSQLGVKEKKIRITDDPPVNNRQPSVDYLFDSIAEVYQHEALGIILTGMGADGVKGLHNMKNHNVRVIAQDESSCVVFGMPNEAIKAGVVDVIAPLDMIKDEIMKNIR